ncbi:MAG: D-alanine--D-alanine ligase [Caldimicrobium sp.]
MPLKPVLKVALLAGGSSSEREVSLKGARAVHKALEELGHTVEFFDPATDLLKLSQKAKEFDCAFLVVHGPLGEDGTLQGFLDMLGLPYQGSGVLGSALAMHKGIAKILYREAGIPVPKGFLIKKEAPWADLEGKIKNLGFPLIVKPATQGSSVGLSLVKDRKSLKDALEKGFEFDRELLIEEYIEGREITVGVLDDKPLPVVEIVHQKNLFDYETKYTPGMAEEICPAPLSQELTEKAQEYALRAHRALHLKHYSRTDMILKDSTIYVLETNTIPGMTETSLLPLAAKVAGLSFKDLIQKLLELTLTKP